MWYTIKVSIPVISAVVKKNVLRLTRSKIAALMIILGPILIMLLAGIAFDQAKLYGVKIGVYTPDADNITQTILDGIKSRDFKIIDYETSEGCVDSVKDGQTHVCIVFSKKKDKTHLEFNVDYSKINLVYTLVNTLSTGLEAQSQKISLGLAEDLFDTVGKTAQIVEDNAKVLSDMHDNVLLMTKKLDNISKTIAVVDTSAPQLNGTKTVAAELNKSQSEITVLQSQANKDLNSYLAELTLLESNVAAIEKELSTWDSGASAVEKNLSEVYDALSCATAPPNDPCIFISSAQDEMSQRTLAVKSAASQITQLKKEIQSAKKDIEETKSGLKDMTQNAQTRIALVSGGLTQVETALSQAKKKSDDLTIMKKSLQSELTSMKTSMQDGLMDLATFNSSMAKLVDDFGDISQGSAESLVSPIGASVKPILANKKILDYLFPSLLVFVLSFTGILLAATIVMKEKSSPAHFRNFITPVSPLLFILGSYATALLILVIQIVILFALGQLAFGISILGNIGPTSLILFLTASVFILLGMSVGYTFKSEETTTLVAISISCIFLLFSSLIVPIENVKSTLAVILQASPFVIADSALRVSLIFGKGILSMLPQLFMLALYACILFFVTLAILKYSLRKI